MFAVVIFCYAVWWLVAFTHFSRNIFALGFYLGSIWYIFFCFSHFIVYDLWHPSTPKETTQRGREKEDAPTRWRSPIIFKISSRCWRQQTFRRMYFFFNLLHFTFSFNMLMIPVHGGYTVCGIFKRDSDMERSLDSKDSNSLKLHNSLNIYKFIL